MYELALLEWGLPPAYLNDEWTEELLALMFHKRSERLNGFAPRESANRMSNEDFFKKYPKLGLSIDTRF